MGWELHLRRKLSIGIYIEHCGAFWSQSYVSDSQKGCIKIFPRCKYCSKREYVHSFIVLVCAADIYHKIQFLWLLQIAQISQIYKYITIEMHSISKFIAQGVAKQYDS